MGKVKRSMRNQSIRVSFLFYVLFYLIIAMIASAVTNNIASSGQYAILYRYSDEESAYYNEFINEEGIIIQKQKSTYDIVNTFTSDDRFWYDLYSTVELFAIPFWFALSIMIAAMLFYNSKLKKPLALLNYASEEISKNNLNFQLDYDSKDEMGKLCYSFEKMRYSLDLNIREMWRTMEERKRLNAAFSHELRTPLTVLRGYSDMLVKYLPGDVVSKEKVIATVNTMSEHVTRLENYVFAMNKLQKLEDISVNPQAITRKELVRGIKETAEILCFEKELVFLDHCRSQQILVDAQIVMQVCENLISNAVCFAKSRISIRLNEENNFFILLVSDDGIGFSSSDLEKATNPFYKSKEYRHDFHFGLGLNICKVFCEKHGGVLTLSNQISGGALVVAEFAMLF